MMNVGRVCRRDVLPARVLSKARRALVSAACSLVILAGVATSTPAPAADPAMVGQWDTVIKWPAVAVHLILLHTGKVLFFRGDGSVPKAYTWDPLTEEISQPTFPGDNVFCSAHSFLPDGRVLVVGGDTGSTGLRSQTLIFDPVTSQWNRGPYMRRGRYYPTTVSLGDGRVMVFSGKDEEPDKSIVEYVEVYVESNGPGSGRWDLLPPTADNKMNYYPRMQLLPSGLVFHVGESPITDVLDPVTATWSTVGTTNYGKRYQGTTVMLPPGHERIMIMGGGTKGGTPTQTAEIIDMSEASPAWRYTNPMHYRREDLNSVILPDGKVMVGGGTDGSNPVYPTELFDPVTETWTLLPSLASKRGYHSTAALLPDGRVLWAGANGNASREIYSPPYLFRGARPVIASAPSSVEYGEVFSVETPDAFRIASVVFIRPAAATHAANMEQRYVPLTFMPADADTIDIVAPTEPNVAPPGYYMLFIVDGEGIPSTAPFVLLGSSGAVPSSTSTTMASSSTTTTTTNPGPTTTTTLPPPRCGDGIVNQAAEECDGVAAAACPGLCLPECRCAVRLQGAIEADVTANASGATTNFGASTELWADANTAKNAFLRVRVSGVGAGTVVQAILRLRTGSASNAGSDSGGRLHTISSCSWDEAAVTWASRPAIDGALLATRGAVGANTTVDFDVTAAVAGDGTYCLALDSLSEDGVTYLSRESATGQPELWVAYRPGAGGATTTTTNPAPTTTTTTNPSPATTTTTGPVAATSSTTVTSTTTPSTTTTLPAGATTSVEVRVAASADDAEEDTARRVDLGSSDLELIQETTPQTVGMRFAGVDVPRGARIVHAHIQFTADEAQTEATSLVIQGEATDDAPAFTTAAGNVSSRVRTSAAVPWPAIPAWILGDAGPAQRTPDLSGVIQEIVDRGGWARGHALVIIITGTGHREAESFDGDRPRAALLHVEYEASSITLP